MIKSACIAICLVSLGTFGFGQSLGEIAKKEKERREKNEGEARVIDDEALAEAGYARRQEEGSEPSREPEADETSSPATSSLKALLSGGTNRAAESSDPAPPRDTSPEAPSPANRADAERDIQKQMGIAKLESLLSSMRGPALGLVNAVMRYQQNCTGSNSNSVCADEINQLARQAIIVGKMLNEAHNLARRSGVTPGELRALREKHGLDHQVWDAAIRFAAKYGH